MSHFLISISRILLKTWNNLSRTHPQTVKAMLKFKLKWQSKNLSEDDPTERKSVKSQSVNIRMRSFTRKAFARIATTKEVE